MLSITCRTYRIPPQRRANNMATKLKDSATAEKAALNLNQGIEVPATGEPNTPREKTTSERLFPDFTTEDGAITNRPVRDRNPAPVTETPAPATQGPTPITPASTPIVYLSPEEM